MKHALPVLAALLLAGCGAAAVGPTMQTAAPAQVRQTVTGSVPPAGSCHYRSAAGGRPLPDATCTPGATDPRVTRQTIGETICRKGYTAAVRPPVDETDRAKRLIMLAYATERKGELDHLVPLELGGSSDVKNLWPEPGPIPNPKDRVETQLHDLVCSGRLQLATAQRLIAADWTTAESKALQK